MFLKKVPVYVLGAAMVIAVAGCGKKKKSGGDDGVDATTLELASELVLLPAKGAGTNLTEYSLDAPAPRRGSSDATVRKLKLRVNSDAFEAAKQVESILCYFSQTRFWEQTGKTQYQALVDQEKCDGDKDDGSQGQEGAVSSNQGKSYVTGFAKSKLDGDVVVGEILFRMEEKGKKKEYHADIRVTTPPSDKYPIGLFELFFTGYQDGQKGAKGSMKVAASGDDKFTIEFMESGDRSSTQLMAELTKDGDDFVGKLNSKGSYSEEGHTGGFEYKVAFDKSYANVAGSKTGGGEQGGSDPTGCYDRNSFITAIHNYDLADPAKDNALVELNTGFPIEATIDGKTAMGFAGYHGIGFMDRSLSSKVTDGMKVSKIDYADRNKKTEYTVTKAPGRLIKLTRSTTTLGALKNTDIMIHDSGSQYLVHWDGTNFVKKAKVEFKGNGPEESAASGNLTLPNWGTFAYVPSLNAGVRIPGTVSDSTTIGYHSEEFVTSSGNAPTESLVCFQDCPKVTFTSKDDLKRSNSFSNGCMPAQPMFFSGDAQTWGGNCATTQKSTMATALATYTFNSTTMNISKDGTAFALPDVSSIDERESHEYSFRSGALIPSSLYTALSAPVKAGNPSNAENELEYFYRWESGANSWSQLTVLKDSAGTVASFDRPKEISYTHSTANDFDGKSTYDGKSFRLSYGGPGQMWGIPMKYNADFQRPAPMFAIKTGSKAGDYIVHAVRGEQYMKKESTTANCTALDTSAVPALPTAVDTKSDAIDKSAISDATEIRYVGGESAK